MIASLVHRLRHPQTTVRWRLTLMYGGLFLVCGAALLAVTYVLVSRGAVTQTSLAGPAFLRALAAQGGPPNATFPGPSQTVDRSPTGTIRVRKEQLAAVPLKIRKALGSKAGRQVVAGLTTEQRLADLNTLELWSAIALGIMAIISGALGWVVAGRVLRPLRTITAMTQQISEANLHERLALAGPRDELRTLADTIDGLLGRLQGAFEAQRRFVANASHELRTPLTAAQALLEMVMSDPNADVETFRVVCAQVLEESAQQEELIDALLALARGQRGIDRREPVALDELADQLLKRRKLDMQANGLTLDASLEHANAAGDRRLLDRLISNLLDNAIRHNIHGGRVTLNVATTGDGRAALSIANTGATVPPDEVERLLAPFQRMAADRTGPRDGLGLGLSIVAAIASAHGATLDVRPRGGGGLEITVQFPSAHAPAPEPAPDPEPAPAVA